MSAVASPSTIAASQPGDGTQSSSVNATRAAPVARQPRLRAAAGPALAGCRSTRTGTGAAATSSASVLSVPSVDASSTTTTSYDGTPRWLVSAATRRGRSV